MPARAAWDDYEIIQWQSRNAPAYAALKRLGVSAAMVMADRDGTGTPVQRQFAPMQAAGLSWYVENIATDFYASYHRWSPPREVNWRFVEAQQRLRQNPDDQTIFRRDPSFADPVWQQRIRDRLIATVHEQSRYHPLYYSLGDETGIADLTAFFDFDLSPASLEGMREWLRQGYGSLAALNAEWGTDFARWEDVRPETTRQAMRRADDNFAAWADFKAWMDVAFARALRMGTDAVHSADPTALAAIEGVQIPGWGGYDYSLLVDAVDVMELDDPPLAHSLNPHLIMLNTSFGGEPRANPRDLAQSAGRQPRHHPVGRRRCHRARRRDGGHPRRGVCRDLRGDPWRHRQAADRRASRSSTPSPYSTRRRVFARSGCWSRSRTAMHG